MMDYFKESILNKNLKYRSFTFCIYEHLHERLENHLYDLKAVKIKRTKSNWILEAIVEKMQKENLTKVKKRKRQDLYKKFHAFFCRKYLAR